MRGSEGDSTMQKVTKWRGESDIYYVVLAKKTSSMFTHLR